MLDAHQLNIFLVAAETLNFTLAAERLHLSQPSISQHIRALEKHFDEKLFVRQGRSLILSDAGKALIPLARQFVKQSTSIDEAMASFKGHIKGRINLGCNATSGKYIMPEYFARFHRLYPEVTIYCQTDDCASPLETLRNGTHHFVFTIPDRVFEACFETIHLLSEDITLITPPNHPWAKRETVKPEELLGENFILPTENMDIYDKLNTALAAKNLSLYQLKSFLQLSNSEAIILSVAKGLGVGFSSKIVSSIIGDAAFVPIEGLKIERDILVVRDKTQPSTAARDAFWEFMGNIGEELRLTQENCHKAR